MRNKRKAKELDDKATALLEDHGLLEAPVDVEALARHLGADVVYENLEDDVSGFLLRDQGVSTIAINQHHPTVRQRFTLGHECGHLFLHANRGDRLWLDRERIFFRDSSSSSGDQYEEIEANQFAACVLMPETLVRAATMSVGELDDSDIPRLAQKFEVSERAMMFRLISVGLIETVAA